MPGSPMMRAGFSDLMYPGLNEAYLLAFNAYPTEYDKFLNMGSSSRKDEEDAVTVGFGLVPEKTEGDSPVYDALKYVDSKKYTHKTYALGYEVTEEAFEDELYGIIKKASGALAVSVKQTLDTLGASVLNNAFDTDYLGVDGSALCVDDHPQAKAGGTVSNVAAVDFDATALYSALETIELWTNDEDLPLRIMPKHVVSSPGQRRIITQTLGGEKQPFTSDNEINAIREWELQRMILHYLTDEDAWWILSPQAEHFLKWFWRVRPVFRNFDDPNTGNAKFMVRFRASYGFTHWWGVYGSPGV